MTTMTPDQSARIHTLRESSVDCLNVLRQLWNEQHPEKDEAEIVMGQLTVMANNIIQSIASEQWQECRPLADARLITMWIAAGKVVKHYYGETGKVAYSQVSDKLVSNFEFEKAMARAEQP
jgi:hypothetical protein